MDGLEREIEATIYDFKLNGMTPKRTAKRIMALIANKEPVAEVPCSAGLASRFNIGDNIVEEAAMELDTILGDYLDMTEITKPGTYSKTIRRWIAKTLNKAC